MNEPQQLPNSIGQLLVQLFGQLWPQRTKAQYEAGLRRAIVHVRLCATAVHWRAHGAHAGFLLDTSVAPMPPRGQGVRTSQGGRCHEAQTQSPANNKKSHGAPSV